MDSKLIYLAGPWDVVRPEEYRTLASVAKSLIEDNYPGSTVFDPADIPGGFADTVVFSRVDLIVLLPNWSRSSWCWTNVHRATDLDIDMVDTEWLIDKPAVRARGEVDCD